MSLIKPLPTLALVLPCFNEEDVLGITIPHLSALLNSYIENKLISADSFALFVDDGSRDRTWNILLTNQSPHVKSIKLSHNVGHQYALMAGLTYVTNKVDCCVSLDADLQDDSSVIEQMIQDYRQGSQIVYGVRGSRNSDKQMKSGTAHLFYRLMKQMGVDLIYDHADFRLLSNKVLVELQHYKEVNLFLRGLFPMMGFQSSIVYYARKERVAGKTKYPFKKMLHLAVDGITSFSNLPLKMITYIGFTVFVASFLISLWVLFQRFYGITVPGWASITLPMYFLGGIQLLALGVIGEYLGKIYMETKARPRYHIEEEA
ncbi:glycosyltransferase family 2 protein [Solitalea canadensis]|uniref:Glycosyl transferase n=1 Tax=Solitalea canadensis (strain ATCC 29591 / DSM 3403 / JCM 21819 / LMG 8368 / NBRC 15130 / NCIMB 12057 / USAM 9D) TaxID=929556 RepID=H8KWP4_SOLCM|nr:glycosyltransferase family 2 protein [Solitalea canadensis]AFD08223.1 glycosyl transferase [Solitalea canadensis DSM 3403]